MIDRTQSTFQIFSRAWWKARPTYGLLDNNVLRLAYAARSRNPLCV